MKITLRQLLYFDALARERHFGRAAERVAVTQPAMSTQIRDLEKLLGAPLVDRSGGQITLTPLGRAVAFRAEQVLDGARAVEAMGESDVGVEAPTRLGLIPTVAPYLVPEFVNLQRQSPIETMISEALTARLIQAVRLGDLDAAVIALPSGVADLHDVHLFDDRFLLAMPDATSRSDWIAPNRPEEINPDRLLLLDEGHCLSDQALAACQMRRDTIRLSLGATSLATVSRLVASGQGITLIPEIAADVEGRGLSLSRFDDPEPSRQIGMITRRGVANSSWCLELTELLKKAHTAARTQITV